MIAIETNSISAGPARPASLYRAPDERLAQHTFLRKLQAGLRSEVWLGLPPGASALEQLVAIKIFFPHTPGLALDALDEELALAQQLSHPNLAVTLAVGNDAERRFVVSEHVDGITLRVLLRRLSVKRQRLAPAVVARVLHALVSVVGYAERQAASVVAKVLVNQAIAADDVFVTFDGDVCLLGFKGKLGSAGAFAASAADGIEDASVYAAVDALLSEHLNPELGALLSVAGRPGVRRLNGLSSVRRVLELWQNERGNDGRAELAALTDTLFSEQRRAQRAALEARLEQHLLSRPAELDAPQVDEDAPPVSGFRPVQRQAVARDVS